jgi:hypothetical protein
MTVIHPMAVIDRLNEVFGMGVWNYETEYIDCHKEVQKTKTGERDIWVSAVKGVLTIDDLILEQFGGSTNDDMGDALKGGSTDALTKIASYLGIGASVYKGQGNTEPQVSNEAKQDIWKLMQLKGITEEHLIDEGFTSLKKLTPETAEELIRFLKLTKSKINPNGDPVERE